MSPSQGIRDTGALGVLLAGGQGERLGLGVPKALATLGGTTFYERALTALAALCSHVWVAAPVGMTLPKMTATGSRVIRVNDPPGAGGPLAGIAAVAADATFVIESARDGARIVTLAVDLPLVTTATLHALLAAFDTMGSPPGAAALIPAPGGHAQPMAAVWSLPAVHALARAFADGERSVTRAATMLDARLLDDAALLRLGIADEIARDVDTAADLAAASRWLHDLAREDV
jgi:molybdopterin-guanine dinucleotide biosynthesis protein A